MEDLWHGVAMVPTCGAPRLMVQILLESYLEGTELSSTMASGEGTEDSWEHKAIPGGNG
jgi:hypothetical protein